MLQVSSASETGPGEFLRREFSFVDGRPCEYRLQKEQRAAGSCYTMTVRLGEDAESIPAFTDRPLLAEAFYLLAVREGVLPHTLADIWQEFLA